MLIYILETRLKSKLRLIKTRFIFASSKCVSTPNYINLTLIKVLPVKLNIIKSVGFLAGKCLITMYPIPWNFAYIIYRLNMQKI